MTKTITIEPLLQKKASLEAELAEVNMLLNMLDKYTVEDPTPVAVTSTKAPDPTPISAVEDQKRTFTEGLRRAERTFTAGLRRAVLLALHTGPANEQELSKFLAWEVKRVSTVVGTMLSFEFCYRDNAGKLFLTVKGREAVSFFQTHPRHLVYRIPKVS